MNATNPASLLDRLAAVEFALRTATLNRAQLLTTRQQLRLQLQLQLQQEERAS